MAINFPPNAIVLATKNALRYMCEKCLENFFSYLIGLFSGCFFPPVLFDGFAEEYEKRHDEIFPDLAQALRDAGVSDYSIWLDPQSNHLFGILTRTKDHTMDVLPDTEIMKRWWAHMADIMETNAENVPTQIPLRRVFYLP